VSGYPDSDKKNNAEDAPTGAFVVKPFSVDRLLARLEDILEDARSVTSP
jgi:DNA-binding response OmpR family regulator